MTATKSALTLLDTGIHDRDSFTCGLQSLDLYLRHYASQDMKRRIAAVYVLAETDGQILGYYTLSASSVSAVNFPPQLMKRMPRHDVLPVTLLGRLAIHQRLQNQGYGSVLLVDALKRSFENALVVGAVAVIVDAETSRAFQFYVQHGFIPLPDQSNRLMLPMATISQL